MFPDLDNSVLYSVLQTNNNSIEQTIDALLEFNQTALPDESIKEAPFLLTPSNSNRQLGDYIREIQKKKKKKKVRFANVGKQPITRKSRWVPLAEHLQWQEDLQPPSSSQSRRSRRNKAKKKKTQIAQPKPAELVTQNPFSALEDEATTTTTTTDDALLSEVLEVPTKENEASFAELVSSLSDDAVQIFGSAPTSDELIPLLSVHDFVSIEPQTAKDDSILFDSCEYFDSSFVAIEPEPKGESQLERQPEPLHMFCALNVPVNQLPAEPSFSSYSYSSSCSLMRSPSFRLDDKILLQPQSQSLVPTTTNNSDDDTPIVIKFYFAEDNIHRISMNRSMLSFDRLQERVANHLVQRKNVSAECQAYAITYQDEEGDHVAVCSQEELGEALRVFEQFVWPAQKPSSAPLLRFYVRPIPSASAARLNNSGYILV
jgi:hypothetical protein